MTYARTRSIAVDEIPIIDASALQGGNAAEVAAVGTALRQAAQGPGFFYVRNHGVPRSLIDAVFAASRDFFSLPPEQKQRVKINDLHRGFIAVGGAKMYDKARVDLKESYLWGLELPPDDPDVRAGTPLMGPNNWPDFSPAFRKTLYDYYEAVGDCGRRLLGGLAVSLDVPRDFFEPRFAKPLARGSLIYYPPQPPHMGEEQFGVAPHTDYGGITLLYQDDTGGLQVRGRAGEWLTAHPIPDTFVINIGDLMARWTNDRWVSTLHRVVNPDTAAGRSKRRQSLAFFHQPNWFAEIVCLETCLAPGELPRYSPVLSGPYLMSKFKSTVEKAA